jgi:transcriptional regulator with XRE-family HTH domain
MVILRRVIGEELRRTRLDQARTLRDVAASAQVSLGYLSEVERGRKEASSELLAAICAALDVPLSVLLQGVSDEVGLLEASHDSALKSLPTVSGVGAVARAA